jgi:outer membrane protein OmpA-like peptidoglycan-associated protein
LIPLLAVFAQVAVASPPAVLPYEKGLRLSWVSTRPREPDYETILSVTSMADDAAVIRLSWNRGPDRRWKSIERPMSRRERHVGRAFYHYAEEAGANQFRGYAFGMATQSILEALKEKGSTQVAFLLPEVARTPYRGTLTRVGSEDEAFALLVDGRQVALPAVHATGTVSNPISSLPQVTTDFVILDDPEAAWLLDTRVTYSGGVSRKRIVRVATAASEDVIARELDEQCRASVHDLYFATSSVDLDAASEPALDRIALMLTEHPDWRLKLVGHTDSIGTPEDNLDLSRRRAERVKEALAGEHGIAAARLDAEGRGESQPLDDNGTPDGRARNRRVDLERPCHGR